MISRLGGYGPSLAAVPEWADELGIPGQPVVVVCKTDRRSARVAGDLVAAGVRSVAVLRGGTDRWHQRGLPLEETCQLKSSSSA